MDTSPEQLILSEPDLRPGTDSTEVGTKPLSGPWPVPYSLDSESEEESATEPPVDQNHPTLVNCLNEPPLDQFGPPLVNRSDISGLDREGTDLVPERPDKTSVSPVPGTIVVPVNAEVPHQPNMALVCQGTTEGMDFDQPVVSLGMFSSMNPDNPEIGEPLAEETSMCSNPCKYDTPNIDDTSRIVSWKTGHKGRTKRQRSGDSETDQRWTENKVGYRIERNFRSQKSLLRSGNHKTETLGKGQQSRKETEEIISPANISELEVVSNRERGQKDDFVLLKDVTLPKERVKKEKVVLQKEIDLKKESVQDVECILNEENVQNKISPIEKICSSYKAFDKDSMKIPTKKAKTISEIETERDGERGLLNETSNETWKPTPKTQGTVPAQLNQYEMKGRTSPFGPAAGCLPKSKIKIKFDRKGKAPLPRPAGADHDYVQDLVNEELENRSEKTNILFEPEPVPVPPVPVPPEPAAPIRIPGLDVLSEDEENPGDVLEDRNISQDDSHLRFNEARVELGQDESVIVKELSKDEQGIGFRDKSRTKQKGDEFEIEVGDESRRIQRMNSRQRGPIFHYARSNVANPSGIAELKNKIFNPSGIGELQTKVKCRRGIRELERKVEHLDTFDPSRDLVTLSSGVDTSTDTVDLEEDLSDRFQRLDQQLELEDPCFTSSSQPRPEKFSFQSDQVPETYASTSQCLKLKRVPERGEPDMQALSRQRVFKDAPVYPQISTSQAHRSPGDVEGEVCEPIEEDQSIDAIRRMLLETAALEKPCRGSHGSVDALERRSRLDQKEAGSPASIIIGRSDIVLIF